MGKRGVVRRCSIGEKNAVLVKFFYVCVKTEDGIKNEIFDCPRKGAV